MMHRRCGSAFFCWSSDPVFGTKKRQKYMILSSFIPKFMWFTLLKKTNITGSSYDPYPYLLDLTRNLIFQEEEILFMKWEIHGLFSYYIGKPQKNLFLVARPLRGGGDVGKGLATKKKDLFLSSKHLLSKKNVATKLKGGVATSRLLNIFSSASVWEEKVGQAAKQPSSYQLWEEPHQQAHHLCRWRKGMNILPFTVIRSYPDSFEPVRPDQEV